MTVSRRGCLQGAAAAGLALTLRPGQALAQDGETRPLLSRPIPSSGERLPVIGLGTNSYGVQSEEEIAPLREVIRLLVENGAGLIDTSRVYGRGRSEEVIGRIIGDLDVRDRVFITSKVRAESGSEARAELEASFTALGLDHVPAMLVQSLMGTEFVLPALREWKQAGRIRYLGGSTSSAEQYGEVERLILEEDLDIIQIDYSVVNRGAADRILPLAQDHGVAILINRPLGGRDGNVLPRLAGRPLPDFADAIGASNWAQVCLKYILANPAVTAVIPGVTNPRHIVDNLGAGRGPLPDADILARMERIFDELA